MLDQNELKAHFLGLKQSDLKVLDGEIENRSLKRALDAVQATLTEFGIKMNVRLLDKNTAKFEDFDILQQGKRSRGNGQWWEDVKSITEFLHCVIEVSGKAIVEPICVVETKSRAFKRDTYEIDGEGEVSEVRQVGNTERETSFVSSSGEHPQFDVSKLQEHLIQKAFDLYCLYGKGKRPARLPIRK